MIEFSWRPHPGEVFWRSHALQSDASRDGNLALQHPAPIQHLARRLATPTGFVRCSVAGALPRLVNIFAKCSDDSRGAYAPGLRLARIAKNAIATIARSTIGSDQRWLHFCTLPRHMDDLHGDVHPAGARVLLNAAANLPAVARARVTEKRDPVAQSSICLTHLPLHRMVACLGTHQVGEGGDRLQEAVAAAV